MNTLNVLENRMKIFYGKKNVFFYWPHQQLLDVILNVPSTKVYDFLLN